MKMDYDPLVERDQLVTDLRGALYDGRSGLEYVPELLRKLLETEAWRERYDGRSRQPVRFSSFAEFVTTPPTEGLGASMDLVDRIVGNRNPHLLRLLKAAKAGKPGRPSKDGNPCESQGFYGGTDYTAERLAREHPDEYAAVERGEKKIHRAAVDAGIRRRRLSVRLDDAASAARTLRNNSSPEYLAELRQLLDGEAGD